MRGTVLASLLAICVVSLSACGRHATAAPEGVFSAAPEGVFFPRLTEHSDSWPASLAFGTLVEKDGCVFLMPGDALLIWPHEASAERTSGGALRISVDDDLVGQTGDEVQLGGGLIGESRDAVDQAEHLIGEPIPERCRPDGGYWLTAPPS